MDVGEIWLEWFGFGLFERECEVTAERLCIDFDFVLDRKAFGGGGFGECDGQFG